MSIRLTRLVVALAVAGALSSVHAAPAAATPLAVQERVLVLPKLPGDAPMNLPQEGSVKLPFATGGAPGVAARINATVWREMLDGATAPTAPGKTWTPPADKLPQGTTSLEYTATLLPAPAPRLLALAFSGEGCGAYCETYTTTTLFDLRDGRRVFLTDLVSVDGFTALGHRVDAERKRAYETQARTLRAAIKAAPRGKKKDADDDDGDRLMLAQDCLKQVASQPSTAQSLLSADLTLDGHGGLALKLGRCSNHAMAALDDVGDITVKIPAAELQPALTPYGATLVRQDGDAPAPPPPLGRELHGRLGGLAITMKLEPLRDGVDTGGWYAYDKYRTHIALTVHKDGDTLRATEQTASQGRFDLTIAGGALAGTWTDKDDRKLLSVVAE